MSCCVPGTFWRKGGGLMIDLLFGVALALAVAGCVVFRLAKGKSPGVMNMVLLISALLLAWFTVTMIRTFQTYGMIPDTLVNCVFMALAGEAGVMGWIKTSKEKYRDRRWQKEDQKELEEAAKRPAKEGREKNDQ